MAIIEAEGLRRSFGEVHAVRGVDLSVERGTVCGLLGPNGAGKTTLVRILTTLLRPDGGWARVGGIDVNEDPERVRFLIGLAGQQAAVDELLTGRANLQMVGRLYHLPVDIARRRADELLERFDLSDAAERIAKTYSGGMRRRLDLAASLVANPPILFLDEPTTGLDPASRIEMWTVLRGLVAAGTTLLLTTQYLDEADELADQIVVIDHGLVIAEGTPDQLKRSSGAAQVDVLAGPRDSLTQVAASVARATGNAPEIDLATRHVTAWLPAGGLAAVVREMDAERLNTDDIAVHRPTLNDVFLGLTGHGIDKEEEVA